MTPALALLFQIAVTLPDTGRLAHKNGLPRPLATAVRVTRSPAIDGVLDESEWRSANPATGFRQLNPKEGDAGSGLTEVRILYDDQNIYVGARMFERHTSKIRARRARQHDRARTERRHLRRRWPMLSRRTCPAPRCLWCGHRVVRASSTTRDSAACATCRISALGKMAFTAMAMRAVAPRVGLFMESSV